MNRVFDRGVNIPIHAIFEVLQRMCGDEVSNGLKMDIQAIQVTREEGPGMVDKYLVTQCN